MEGMALRGVCDLTVWRTPGEKISHPGGPAACVSMAAVAEGHPFGYKNSYG